MQPKGNPKTLVCFRLTRQCPIFSSLSDTNKVKNKTALDMRDFLTWVGGVNLKIPFIRKFKTDINLSLNPVRIVDKTYLNTYIQIFGAIFRQETEFYFCLLSQNVQGKIVTRNQF